MELVSIILPYIQVVLAVVLVAMILLQQSEAGLGSAFGGTDSANSFRQKRGMEKVFFNSTIVIAILFTATSLLALFL